MERFDDTEFWDAVDVTAGCPLPSETPRAYDPDVESLIRWARVVRLTTTLKSAVPYQLVRPMPSDLP